MNILSTKTLSSFVKHTALIKKAGMTILAIMALSACGSGSKSAGNRTIVPGLSGNSSGSQVTTVNRYLWGASLETVNFLPIASADPISGLIITDWYVNPESTSERFKVNVYILDQVLRADALRVTVFRQVREGGTGWVDAKVNPSTPREMENAILNRARQLRLNSLE